MKSLDPGLRRGDAYVRVLPFLLLLALAGCGGLGNLAKPSPKTHFYTLSVEGAPGQAELAKESGSRPTRISVSRAVIPGVVDRPQIVARTASNRVEILDFHRWAEPLEEAIPRAIAGYLGSQLGPRYAVAAGSVPGLPPDLRVSLDVQRFDAVIDGGVTIDALWSVRPAAGEARAGRSVVEERSAESGPAGIAAAYSRALAGVAREIAAAISAAK